MPHMSKHHTIIRRVCAMDLLCGCKDVLPGASSFGQDGELQHVSVRRRRRAAKEVWIYSRSDVRGKQERYSEAA